MWAAVTKHWQVRELASLAASFPSRLLSEELNPRRGSGPPDQERAENTVVGQMQCQGEVGYDKGLMRI